MIKVCDSQAHSTLQERYTGTPLSSLPWAVHMAPASQSAIVCMREHVALNPAHSSGKHGPGQPDRSLHVQWRCWNANRSELVPSEGCLVSFMRSCVLGPEVSSVI